MYYSREEFDAVARSLAHSDWDAGQDAYLQERFLFNYSAFARWTLRRGRVSEQIVRSKGVVNPSYRVLANAFFAVCGVEMRADEKKEVPGHPHASDPTAQLPPLHQTLTRRESVHHLHMLNAHYNARQPRMHSWRAVIHRLRRVALAAAGVVSRETGMEVWLYIPFGDPAAAYFSVQLWEEVLRPCVSGVIRHLSEAPLGACLLYVTDVLDFTELPRAFAPDDESTNLLIPVVAFVASNTKALLDQAWGIPSVHSDRGPGHAVYWMADDTHVESRTLCDVLQCEFDLARLRDVATREPRLAQFLPWLRRPAILCAHRLPPWTHPLLFHPLPDDIGALVLVARKEHSFQEDSDGFHERFVMTDTPREPFYVQLDWLGGDSNDEVDDDATTKDWPEDSSDLVDSTPNSDDENVYPSSSHRPGDSDATDEDDMSIGRSAASSLAQRARSGSAASPYGNRLAQREQEITVASQ
jgi:hypothetical protein